MQPYLTARLSLMMFLQFFIWGAWYVTVGNYMAANGLSEVIHWAYTVGPVSALISPFVVGNLADRFFSTEKVLVVLNLLAGVAMLAAAQVGGASAPLFIGLLFLHTICFFPTIGLTSTLCFHNMNHPEKQFPRVRMFGSIGWIAAGVLASLVLGADETALPLHIAGYSALVMGVYCLSLPATPPKGAAVGVTWRQRLGLDAFDLLKKRPFLVFALCELLISIPLSTYYAYAPVYINAAGIPDPGFQMSFGQMTEVLFMFFMPWVLLRLGVKRMILVGFVAWVLRFAFLAAAAPGSVYAFILIGILLHGICFDFVYIAGQIFVDRQVTPATRGQAQGLLVMLRSGIGLLTGAQFAGWLFNVLLDGDLTRMPAWQLFWAIPGVMALVILLGFAAYFNEKETVKA
ncbi:MAG: MFS transporter [Rhodothermales bacterium]